MKMYSIETAKIALSNNDNKRIPMKEDPFMTYTIGHYKTKVKIFQTFLGKVGSQENLILVFKRKKS